MNLNRHWKSLLISTLITGLIIEFLNSNVNEIWIYRTPWNLLIIPQIKISLIVMILGWFLLWLVSFLFASLWIKTTKDKALLRSWLIGWFIGAFFFEIFNSKVFRAWDYPAYSETILPFSFNIFGNFIIPGLEFGVLVPLGYVGCGLIAYYIYLLLKKFNRKTG